MDDEVANQIFALQYMTLLGLVWLSTCLHAEWRRQRDGARPTASGRLIEVGAMDLAEDRRA